MLKKFTRIQFYFLVAFAATLFSTYIHARELPGTWEGGLQLGIAYDSTRHQEIMAPCVAGNPVSIGKASGELLYTSEASFEKIVRAFDGSVSADVNAPFVKAKASFEYARENASTDNRMNWFFEFNATRKSTTFALNGFGLSDYGREAIQEGYAVVPEWCGDEFVSKVDYGASLVGTMSVEFASKEDKESFKLAAALDVDFMVGRVQASAEMNKMQQKMGSRTIVKVHAHQKGGDPGNLNGILGNAEIVRCRLSDMDNCLRAFENILRYANGDFKEQLRNENGYDAIRFYTTPYKNSAARRLVPPQGLPVLERTVLLKRKQIQDAYERELAFYTRASYVNTRLEHFTPAPQLVVVRDIIGKSWSNILELTTAMEECLQHPNRRCLDYRYDLQIYDKDKLEVKFTEQLDPNSNLGKLHQAVKENDVNAADQTIRFGGNQLITQCDPQGFNACHRSVEKGYTRLLSLFIEEDPYKDVADKRIVYTPCDNARKYTPMHLAAEGGTFEHVQCMDLLCAKGAGVDCKTASGLTPLQVAVSCGNKETTNKLVSMGANVNVRDDENRTLLHLASDAGNVDVINYLIVDKKLNVNENDKNGMTPLHWAARAEKVEVINALLGYGADHQAKDREGRMALDIGLKNEDVTKKLLKFHQLPFQARESIGGKVQSGIGLSFSPDSSKFASGYAGSNIFNTKTGEGNSFGSSTVRCTAFSPDASMLAWGGDDNIFRLSSIRGGSQLNLHGHDRGIYGCAFNPRGLTLASASSDKTIKIWRTDTGACLHTLIGHGNTIYGVDFSPDGLILASGSDDATVKIWNPETGALLHTVNGHVGPRQDGHRNYVRSISFSPDGSMLASGSADKTIKIWDTTNWNLIRTIQAHDGWVEALAFSPDNLLIASGATHDPLVKFWDVKNGALVHAVSSNGAQYGIRSLAFSPDGFTLAVGSEGPIKLWNLRWESILHHAVRGGNFNVVKTVAEKFPLLFFIRTPQGQSPLELAEKLLLDQGDIINQDIQAIVDYLRR